jgi:lysosomal acid lipase/cholesteryl ester hydrolase
VTTNDGYILSLQRIPSGSGGASAASGGGKVPVLLQHGLMMVL